MLGYRGGRPPAAHLVCLEESTMPILSLCTGYGGLDDAVQEVTGDRLAAYAEIMPEASAVLKFLHPELTNLGDVSAIDWEELARRHPEVDVIAAGFPCQDISDAGRREGINGSRSRLWFDVLAATCAIRPRLLFLENVDAIRTNGLDEVSRGLNEAGYTLVWTVIRASSVGAPHQRDRWFGLAFPSDSPVTVGLPRLSNDKTPSGVFGTPMVGSHCGPGDLLNKNNQSRLETQVVTDPDNPHWVDRRPAMDTWERIIGRPAPSTTNPCPGAKAGKHLSPRFVEWMMGLPEGRVTSDLIGLSREGQIAVLGGGVVPLQGVRAFKVLMENKEVMMPLTDAAKALFDWDETSRHAPLSTEVDGNGFRTPCRCGYPGRFITSSPSHSYNSTRVHVTNENRREEEGGEKVDGADYTASGEVPRSVRRAARATVPSSRAGTGARRASQGTPGTPCGCGCGEPRGGGLFRPGHDSKLLSRLQTEVRSGSKTAEQALEEVKQIGASEKLIAKLAGRLSA